jgi:mRNA interferase RelE/StbE
MWTRESIALSADFQIAETDTFRKRVSSDPEAWGYQKIAAYVYPQLRRIFFGPNIKKLKGEFEGVYRYRLGDRRLFYRERGTR